MSNATAVIYARVSDKKQAAEDVSVPAQIEAAHRRATEIGATVLRVFADRGRTAYKEGQRPQFEAAIEFATSTGVSHFITWSSSRFARNKFEAAIFKRALLRGGVQLIYTGSDIDLSTDEGWLLDSMFEVIDEMYSRQNAKDTKRSMLRNATMGYFCGGRAPYGYASRPAADDAKRRRLVIVPDEADLVRRMFAMREAGLGAYQIASTWNAEGLRNRGKPWTKRVVLALLRNEAVIGMTVFNRKDSRRERQRPREDWVVVQSHTAIIARDQFDRVQRILDDAGEPTVNGSPQSRHPFTGILRCGGCGGAMVTETARSATGKTYSYYRCRKVRLGEPCTDGRRLRADHIDHWLSETILQCVFTPENVREIVDAIDTESDRWAEERDRRGSTLTRKATELRDRNARLYDILELHGRDAPNLGDLTERLRANSEEIKALEAEHAQLDAARPQRTSHVVDIEEIAAFMRTALTSDAGAIRARTFYRSFIDRITIDGDTATIDYNPARLAMAAPGAVHSSVKWRARRDSNSRPPSS